VKNSIPTTENEIPGPTLTSRKPSVKTWGGWIAGVFLLASATNLASTGFSSFDNWLSFAGVTFLAAFILLAGIWLLQGEEIPNKLIILVVGAAVMRLLFGALWL